MTIKQVIVGAVVGSAIVGIMVQRMRAEKDLHEHAKVIASARLSPHASPVHRKHGHISEADLFSRKLFG